MQQRLLRLLRASLMPLLAIAAIVATGLVAWFLPPAEIAIIGGGFALAGLAGCLLYASLLLGLTALFRRPLPPLRAAMLGAPAGVLVAAVLGLQAMRLLGPLTIGAGALIVVLTQYLLWPRPRIEP